MTTSKIILVLIIFVGAYYTHVHHKTPHGKEFREREKFRAEDNVSALTRIEEGGEIKIEQT